MLTAEQLASLKDDQPPLWEHISPAARLAVEQLSSKPESAAFKHALIFMNNEATDYEAVWIWGKSTANGIKDPQRARAIHLTCVERILRVFGVPMGPRPRFMLPPVPGLYKKT